MNKIFFSFFCVVVFPWENNDICKTVEKKDVTGHHEKNSLKYIPTNFKIKNNDLNDKMYRNYTFK
jgi:hypothetical protein